MKATELLVSQHNDVAKLFKRLEAAERGAKEGIFETLAAALVAHDGIERKIFYPACEAEMGLTDELGEALVEHGLVEFCLFQADEARGKPDFDFKVEVLKEIVEHHVEEEQEELLPKAAKALGAERNEELGVKMEAAFTKAQKEDFRGPLHKNLQAVLQGVLKPGERSNGKPAKKPASKAKAASGTRGAP